MDYLLQIRLIMVGSLMGLFGLVLGVGFVVGRLMHRREWRQAVMLTGVERQVEQEMGDLWGIITRLSERLSPDAWLRVCGVDERLCPVRLTVKPSGRFGRWRQWREGIPPASVS